MCIVSNIGDYYGKRYPEWPTPTPWEQQPFLPIPPMKGLPYVPQEQIEEAKRILDQLKQFKRLVKEAEKADAKMGEADCERAEVKKFIVDVLARLDGLEKRIRQLEGLE